MDKSTMLATAPCTPTSGSALVDRARDQRARSGASPVVGQGTAFAWHPVAPQHQPFQRPSASRSRIR